MASTPTPNDDLLVDTSGDDIIDGLPGNDVINGLDGNDSLIGGDGNCRVPDGCIDRRRLALFAGREFFHDLIITLTARQSGEFRP